MPRATPQVPRRASRSAPRGSCFVRASRSSSARSSSTRTDVPRGRQRRGRSRQAAGPPRPRRSLGARLCAYRRARGERAGRRHARPVEARASRSMSRPPAHYDDAPRASRGSTRKGRTTRRRSQSSATGSLGAGDARAEDTSKQRRLLFITIVGGLAALLGAAAVVFARRQKKATALEKEAEEVYEARLQQAEHERAAKRSAHDAAVRAHQESLTRAQEAARAAAQREAERGSSVPAPQRMVCPTCRREYPLTSAYCPQDATKLVPFQGGGGDVGGPAMGSICPACKRGFPAGTRVCPQDGEELVPYAMHAAVGGPGERPPRRRRRGRFAQRAVVDSTETPRSAARTGPPWSSSTSRAWRDSPPGPRTSCGTDRPQGRGRS